MDSGLTSSAVVELFAGMTSEEKELDSILRCDNEPDKHRHTTQKYQPILRHIDITTPESTSRLPFTRLRIRKIDRSGELGNERIGSIR